MRFQRERSEAAGKKEEGERGRESGGAAAGLAKREADPTLDKPEIENGLKIKRNKNTQRTNEGVVEGRVTSISLVKLRQNSFMREQME